MADNVILNKVAAIERCLKRINEEYDGRSSHLREDQTKQDSIILNLERAAEASIDIAMRLVRKFKLGLPQESREAFTKLQEAKLLPTELATRLEKMVGFRNIAIHNYQSLNLDVVETILKKHLDDFREWNKLALALSETKESSG